MLPVEKVGDIQSEFEDGVNPVGGIQIDQCVYKDVSPKNARCPFESWHVLDAHAILVMVSYICYAAINFMFGRVWQ